MLLVLVGCVGCDQATKQFVRVRLPEASAYSFLGDVVRVQHVENHGAFLSLGAALSEPARFGIFVVAVALALAGLAAYMIRKPGLGATDIGALSLILGGGIGNLIDRIVLHGGVTDFLNFGIGPVRTGIFNVADVAIMAGAAMIVVRSFRNRSATA